jgi:hypothetical protein
MHGMPRQSASPLRSRNYGKTPVIEMKSSGKILVFYGEGTLAQVDKFFATFDENHPPIAQKPERSM